MDQVVGTSHPAPPFAVTVALHPTCPLRRRNTRALSHVILLACESCRRGIRALYKPRQDMTYTNTIDSRGDSGSILFALRRNRHESTGAGSVVDRSSGLSFIRLLAQLR